MLTARRLKRIKSYISPSNGNQSASILNKFCCELVDEVERLRIVLRDIADGVHCIPPDGKHDWDALNATREDAANALREPDLGPPDFVCVRPAKCRICGRESAHYDGECNACFSK